MGGTALMPSAQIGDIPDADIKPPDNVLFVCKLNAVTSEEDLETIFSRFGPCTADIIKVLGVILGL